MISFDERATDGSIYLNETERGTILWRKVAYIIEHPAPTINGTHYVRNRRSAGALFVLFERRFLGACRPAFIDARPIDNPDKLAGKDSIDRERERGAIPIPSLGFQSNENRPV